MKLLVKYWKKTPVVVKMVFLLVSAVLLHMTFFRQSGRESFGNGQTCSGNPKSCTYYYMTNCGHCKRFTPDWDAFVKSYKGPVILKKVEMNDAGDDLKKYNINGFPTVLIIDENGDSQVYDGPRTVDGLMSCLSK